MHSMQLRPKNPNEGRRMRFEQFFPYLIAVLEIVAGAVYAWKGGYRFAIIWFCVGVANLAFAGAKTQ
jgi:hypothetical protein